MDSVKRFGDTALLTPANLVTIFRVIFAVPLLIFIARDGASWVTFGGCVLLGVTDGLDGWLARRGGTTRSGAYLDPIADKFLVIGALGALVMHRTFWWLPVALIATRELIISAFRSILGRRGAVLPARQLGKGKTMFQLFVVAVAVFPITQDWITFQKTLLWIAVALTLISGVDIVIGFIRQQRRLGSRAV